MKRSLNPRVKNPPADHDKENVRTIALTGNPNVGKSTVFNALTGLRQHTGNWPGKTVEVAQGRFAHNGQTFRLVDLPGTYSLSAHSPEEEVAREFLCSGEADAVVIVCDATCLERNLNLVFQILELSGNVIVCLNLIDEADRKGIHIDAERLSQLLGAEVVCVSARNKRSLLPLMDAMNRHASGSSTRTTDDGIVYAEANTDTMIQRIAQAVITYDDPDYSRFDRAADRVLTGKKLGYPLMILLLAGLLWLTIIGANYPSQLLMTGLFRLGERMNAALHSIGAPPWLHDALIRGVWRVLAWVVSVMLPPMAIFFPLFTLLEDAGYLPRIAFNLDKPFHRCKACGKQALTMCMGFGCNAAGVVGCRIIDSPRERLLAILTNSFVPCNGRFPILIALLTIFFVTGSSLLTAALLTLLLLLGIVMTFAVTKLLSNTLLKGETSSFTLELPPYRRPQIGQVLVRSLLDRTLFVLGRAAAVAAPAGLILWILANTGGEISLLAICAESLEPLGRAMGMDGAILLAFLLGWPANETVIPILLMIYLSTGELVDGATTAEIGAILSANGWTWATALSVLLFTLMHWPCSTTLLTVYRETKSVRWTALAAMIPTLCGTILCVFVHFLLSVF